MRRASHRALHGRRGGAPLHCGGIKPGLLSSRTFWQASSVVKVPPQNFVYWLTFQPDTTERTKSPVAVPKPESRLRFPELALRLPPEREPWMSEDQRMAISDAQVSAVAFFKGVIR